MRTRILITVGDINGIGPEIILKALRNPVISGKYDITVITPLRVQEYYYRKLHLKGGMENYKIISICEGKANVNLGEITEESGYISGFAVKTAVELCLKNRYDAIVTAPISKKALHLGGFLYEGHTEMLSDLSGSKHTAMIMLHKKMNIGFASTHPPLKNVPKILTKNLLKNKIKVCINAAKNDLGIKKPRIGVLSLNPHAGENGQIGDEEIKTIIPVIDELNKESNGAQLSGPYPSDSYFAVGKYKDFDMTFAMYHDQGFIPFKMVAGFHGVNYTSGLSFIRTSPDHGTAFDIAGKNIADESGMIEAIRTADKLYKTRVKNIKSGKN
ncbi:MAG: 4-hydroxythreonine-4-phosphate dehydrogenase PdxA [Ignavibacteria bacterium]|jgi:4-hydroxythreonine-4-phosphate dehydrogenase